MNAIEYDSHEAPKLLLSSFSLNRKRTPILHLVRNLILIAGIVISCSTGIIADEQSPRDRLSIPDAIHDTLEICVRVTPVWQLPQRIACYQSANEQYSILLTKTYAEVLAQFPRPQQLLVQNSQRQWIAYRAAWGGLHSYHHPTPLQTLHQLEDTTEATRMRIFQLLAVWPGLTGEHLSIRSGAEHQ